MEFNEDVYTDRLYIYYIYIRHFLYFVRMLHIVISGSEEEQDDVHERQSSDTRSHVN